MPLARLPDGIRRSGWRAYPLWWWCRDAPPSRLPPQDCLPCTGKQFIEPSMKAIGLVLVVMSLAGCATQSKFASDPRAAVVGPAYLDYIAEYPSDRDTQYYYPSFTVAGVGKWVDLFPSEMPSSSSSIDALLTDIPEPSPAVKDLTGKGYPLFEQRSGLLVFTGTNYQTQMTETPSTSFFSQFWVP